MAPVVVPDALRPIIWQALGAEIRRRRVADGTTTITGEMLRFLETLRYGGDAPDDDRSDCGSVLDGTGTVWLTAMEVADVMSCSDRWARTIAQRIGVKVGGVWLVEKSRLEEYRHDPSRFDRRSR